MTRDEAAKIWAAADAEVREDVDADLAREWGDRQYQAYDATGDCDKERTIAEIRAIEAARVLLGFPAEPEYDEDENASDGELVSRPLYDPLMPGREIGTVYYIKAGDAPSCPMIVGYAAADSTDNGDGTYEAVIAPGTYTMHSGQIKI